MHSPTPTERIGRYDVYSEIAAGGMAAVFLGRETGHLGTGRTVAIKRLLPHVANEPEFVQMFLDEARLAQLIHNDHVVATLDIVSSAGELALVMEYIHGEALSKLLSTAVHRGERIDPRIAIAIAVGILDGLHAAHEARNERGSPLEIVHRDISPQNVLVGTDGIARVFDFGIAKAADRLHTTEDGSLKGKLAYMAPEQLETGIVDRRADIWAASVVLWEMLAGKRLFVADSQHALMHVVLTRDIPSLRSFGLPPALDAILARGLARDARSRYRTADDMAGDLLGVISPASPRTVAAWVERNASTELGARARLVADVEKSHDSGDGPTIGHSRDEPDGPTIGHSRDEPDGPTIGHARGGAAPPEHEHQPFVRVGKTLLSRVDPAYEEDPPTSAWTGAHDPDSRPPEERTVRASRPRRSLRRDRARTEDAYAVERARDREASAYPRDERDAVSFESRPPAGSPRASARRSRRDSYGGADFREPPMGHRPSHAPPPHVSARSGAPPRMASDPRLMGTVRPASRTPTVRRASPVVAIAIVAGTAALVLVVVLGVVRRNGGDEERPFPPAVALPIQAPPYLGAPTVTAATTAPTSDPMASPTSVPAVMPSVIDNAGVAAPAASALKYDPRRPNPRTTPPRR